jgi:hypothetical protein
MTDLREATDRPMCECPKCGRAHWKLADSPPSQRSTITLHGADLREATTLINDAVFAAIEAAGWQVVPKEPTQEMIDVAGPTMDDYYDGTKDASFEDSVKTVFRAMLAAAPKPGGER